MVNGTRRDPRTPAAARAPCPYTGALGSSAPGPVSFTTVRKINWIGRSGAGAEGEGSTVLTVRRPFYSPSLGCPHRVDEEWGGAGMSRGCQLPREGRPVRARLGGCPAPPASWTR